MNKITVVIPLYNKAPYIKRAVDSVLEQTFRDFELIVVDDGSTDKGGQIVGSINDDRIRLITQKNAGECAARNTGIKAAKTALIAFLDADDRYNPDFLAVILGLVKKYKMVGVYGTSYETLEGTGQRTVWPNSSLRSVGVEDVLIRDYFHEVLLGPVVCSSAVAIPMKIFDEIGFFPESVQLAGDQDMWMRIGAKYPMAVSSYIGAVYHRDAANRIDTGRIMGIEYELVKTGLRLLSSAKLGRGEREHLHEYICKHQIITAAQLILLGQRVMAMKILLQCKTRKFFLSRIWWLFWSGIPTPVTAWVHRMKRMVVPAND